MSPIEQKFREKIRAAGGNADEIIAEVQEYPDYFVMEGGLDGTFAHAEWYGDFGHLKPEIIDFAVECGGEV